MKELPDYDFSFETFAEFCTKNNLSKDQGIKAVFENINYLDEKIKKLKDMNLNGRDTDKKI